MNDATMAYEWFRNLIDEEIQQELGTIENERIWANGSPDDDTAEMHEGNINSHELYIRILKEAYRNAIGEEYDHKKVHSR